MKILILTDSLGAPRKDIEVEDTWVYKFIRNYSENNVIYTLLVRGLSTNWVNTEFIEDFKPDLVIYQVGIVDATRRAINRYILKIIKLIPGIRTIMHKFLSRYHYQITRMFNIHIANIDKFEKNIAKMKLDTPKAAYCWIPIAPASTKMKKKVFNIESDIIEYNAVIERIFGEDSVLKVYSSIEDVDSIFFDDGHHLNVYGNNVVFSSVEKYMMNNVKE